MSEADIQKWNKKYISGAGLAQNAEPDQELIEYKDFLPTKGLALDLACGAGKNSLYLAGLGLNVVALDGSNQGLALLDSVANAQGLADKIQTLQADLDVYKLDKARYDLIVIVRYLNRDIFADIQAALKPGGVLLYKTFNRKILTGRPGFNPSFTIETDDLIAGFKGMEVIADNQFDTISENAFMLARG